MGRTDRKRPASTSSSSRRAPQAPRADGTAQDRGLDDFWRVYDEHFEAVYAQIIEAALGHPGFGAIGRALTPEQLKAQASDYRLRVQRAIEGDPSSRDAYLREVAHAYAEAGISFADWAAFDSVFADTITPLLVAAYAGDPDRLAASLQAMRRFAQRTAVVLGTAYIEEKERALLASEERYRRLVVHSPAPIVVHVEGRIVFANDASAHTLGLANAGELVGRRLPDLAPPEDREELERRTAVQHTVSSVEAIERRYVRVDNGRVVTLEVVSIPFLFDGRHATLGVARDVTERRRAEGEARRALAAADLERRRLAAIVEALPVGIWIADATGRVTLTNAAAAEIFGGQAPRPEHVAKYDEYGAFWPATGKPVLAEEWPIVRTLRTGQAVVREPIDIARFDGTRGHALFSSVSIPGSGGQPNGAMVVALDITERTKLEEQLRGAQKMEAIGRLAGGVAHDFNNILSVILGYTALMTDDLGKNDPKRADLMEISTAAERAVALTQQLLALGRRQVLQPRAIDLAETLRTLERMLRRLLGEGIELSIQAGAELGAVFADPTQIDQVIMNLVVNARDAMPTGGKLSIELDNVELGAADVVAGNVDVRAHRHVMLAITDTGVGMDAATLAKIFEPFFTTKVSGKGTGLGLATVFGIVRQSGGDIRVSSEPTRGTTFKVYLPRVDGDRRLIAKEPRSGRDAAPRGTETVLLVEDDEQVRALACTVLRRQGYKILEAQNGGEALLVCEQYDAAIDLLITDVVMPRMSGRDLAERLAPLRPKMKVLFMSGYTDDAVVRHGVLTSGLAFLQKPITASNLASTVRRVLDEAPALVTVAPRPAS